MAWKDFPTKNDLPICSNFTLKKTLRYSESFQTFIRYITSVYFSPMFDSLCSPVCFCFLSEVNFKLFDWLVDHFREISKGQLIKECFSFSQPLRAGVFFSPSAPTPPAHFSWDNRGESARWRTHTDNSWTHGNACTAGYNSSGLKSVFVGWENYCGRKAYPYK